MPVPTETFRSTKRLNVWFAITSVVTLAGTAWMFWHDYQRPWRGMQTNYFNVRSAMAHFDVLGYESPGEKARREELAKAVADAEAELATPDNRRRERDLLDREKELNGKLQGVALTYGNMNAEMQVRIFDFEEAKTLHGENDPKTLAIKTDNDRAAKELAATKVKMDELEDDLRDVKGQIKSLYRKRTEAQKVLAAYDKGLNDAKRLDSMYGPGIKRAALNIPLLDYLAPKDTPGHEEVRQIFTKTIRFNYNFVDSYITDRCITCHMGIDDPNLTVENFVRRSEKALHNEEVQETLRRENPKLRREMEQRLLEAADDPEFATLTVENLDDVTREKYIRRLVRAVNDYLDDIQRPEIDVQEIIDKHKDKEPHTRGRIADTITAKFNSILKVERPKDGVGKKTLTYDEMDEKQRMAYVASLTAALNLHLADQGRPPIDFKKEIKAHPHLDLYISPNSAHPMKLMGCTVCHEGAGQDTDFILAAHTPKNKEEMKHWEKEYYVKELGIPLATFHLVEEFWERPMLLPGYTSASCRKCHAQTFDLERHKTEPLASARPIVEGRDLFTSLGCINCHAVDGLTDSRRVGTDLTHVGEKLTTGFIQRWVEYPANFRPSTRMPHFFHQENNLPSSANEFDPDPVLRTEAEIQAIAHYLKTFSKPLEFLPVPEGITGDAKRGEELFVSIGCFACHANLEAKDPLAQGGENLGERWITADLMHKEGISAEDAKKKYEAMSHNDRTRYAMRRLTPLEREAAIARAHEEEVAADREGREPDPKKMYIPAAFSRNAPELTGIGTKLVNDPNNAEQVERGRRWLYNWLSDPRHYSSYTRMPRLFRDNYYQYDSPEEQKKKNDQDILDVAAYLLTMRNDDFKIESMAEDDKHVEEMRRQILGILGGQNTESVSKLILEDGKLEDSDPYGRLTSAIVAQAFKSFGGGEEGKKAVAEIIAERSNSLAERQKLFFGMKMISHYGCSACHTIAGFEEATRPGTDLSLWAQKFMSQLDFAFYSPAFEHEVEDNPAVFGRLYIDSPESAHLIRDADGNPREEILHNHASFAYHKLLNPRIWDREKIKKPYEKLKMPNFYLSEPEARSLTTFLLSMRESNVTRDVQLAYNTTPAGKIAKGRALVRELNCIGCHKIERNEPNISQYYTTDTSVDDNYPFGQRFKPPLLWGEGAKVQYDWLFSFLNNVEMLRPWLKARMPSFHLTKAEATTLVEYFAGLSQYESAFLAEDLDPVIRHLREVHANVAAGEDKTANGGSAWFLDEKLAPQAEFLARYAAEHEQIRRIELNTGDASTPGQIAEVLGPVYDKIVQRAQFLANVYRVEFPFTDPVSHTTDDARFKLGEEFLYNQKCLACHVAGDPSVPGTTTDIKAPNFALTYKRLRYDWVINWLQDPQSIQPGANMPQIFQGGSAFAGVPEETRNELEAKFGKTVPEQSTLLVDFLYNLGERRFTAIQPGGAQAAPKPAEQKGLEGDFDFDAGEPTTKPAEPEFDF
ncbi:MAG TPA: cytochrome c [Phycisphaerae bacterium]|nr:cytochrome c [Phycisphaerae bacterium]